MTATAERVTPSSAGLAGGAGVVVHGVVDAASEVPPGLTGPGGTPLRLVGHGGVAAVVSTLDPDRGPGRRREVLGHHELLDALHHATTVAPVRFGTVLPDDEAVVEELLAPREAVLAATLGDLAGRSQYTVQASYVEDAVLAEIVAADPQVAELRRRTRDRSEAATYAERVLLGELVARALEQHQAVDSEDLLRTILRLPVAHVERPAAGLDRLLDVSVLVDDDAADELGEDLEALAEAVHERMRLRLLGPMAPYDFVPAG